MAEEPQTFRERLKQFALWKWGLCCIFSGLMVGMLTMGGRPTHRPNAHERAQLYGSLAATSLIIVAGIVLIVIHFVRRKK